MINDMHDPQCPCHRTAYGTSDPECLCYLIKRVREDENSRILAKVREMKPTMIYKEREWVTLRSVIVEIDKA